MLRITDLVVPARWGQERGQGCVGTFATSPVITWSHFGRSGDEVPPMWCSGSLQNQQMELITSRTRLCPPESRVWDGMGACESCRQPRATSLPRDRSRARSLRWSLEHLLGGLVGAVTSNKVLKTCGQREMTKEHPKPPHPSMGQACNFGDALADGLCIPKLTLQSAEIPRSKALLANTIQTQLSSQLRADYSEIKFFFLNVGEKKGVKHSRTSRESETLQQEGLETITEPGTKPSTSFIISTELKHVE